MAKKRKYTKAAMVRIPESDVHLWLDDMFAPRSKFVKRRIYLLGVSNAQHKHCLQWLFDVTGCRSVLKLARQFKEMEEKLKGGDRGEGK